MDGELTNSSSRSIALRALIREPRSLSNEDESFPALKSVGLGEGVRQEARRGT